LSKPIREHDPYRDQMRDQHRTSRLERRKGGGWVYVGVTLDSAGVLIVDFTTGSNKGGRFQPLRFRWAMDGTLPEIQGVVTGVAPGDVIFTLPGLYAPITLDPAALDMPIPGVDPDTGLHVAFEVRANGDVVFVG